MTGSDCDFALASEWLLLCEAEPVSRSVLPLAASRCESQLTYLSLSLFFSLRFIAEGMQVSSFHYRKKNRAYNYQMVRYYCAPYCRSA